MLTSDEQKGSAVSKEFIDDTMDIPASRRTPLKMKSRRIQDTESCSSQRRPHKRKIPSVENLDELVYEGIGMEYVPNAPLTLPAPYTCRFCRALKFVHEFPTFCCCNGDVKLAPLDICPQILDLFTRTDEVGIHFKTYSRAYNNFFAFSSIGGDIHPNNWKGIFTFLLQGQLYHFVPNLIPDDKNPRFLQFYFYDGASELAARCNNLEDLRPDIIELMISVTDCNPYAHFFRSLRSFHVMEHSTIRLIKNPTLDQRVYNAPTSDEVVAIVVDDSSSGQANSPHILVYGKADRQHRIMHYYGCYDPLQYPLLFTRGEVGWHQGLKRVSRNDGRPCDDVPFPISSCVLQTADDVIGQEVTASKKKPPKEGKEVSCREYYAYRFQIRPGSYIVHTGRVFLQYIVDMYVKIENARLDFFRKNKSLLRSELYQGVVESVGEGITNAAAVGRRVVLPASFIGGPRDMKCRYLNAMTLVQKFGRPDKFITMTCNPKWVEITSQLRPGETADLRPDLVTRVFRAKFIEMKRFVIDKQIFGPVKAWVSVIEFQKRGLPHAHMLLILDRGAKIFNPESFDKYVCAELPPISMPYLRKLVVQHMLHGPCGKGHEDCSCMRKVGHVLKCKSGYPKEYAEFTTCAEDCYPIYRRRCNGDFVKIHGVEMTNQWVVPYNPYLLAKFDCHINVEVCSTVKAVKYLYKYVYKGHDKVCFDIARNHPGAIDVISAYQSGRWISPPESAWRIFGFDLYDMNPHVIPLPVHLPEMHTVHFTKYEKLQNVVNNEARHRTMLLGFFKANAELENAPNFLYSEFPEHFVWDGTVKAWKERSKKGGPKSVGRLHYVSPSEGERFFLRLLLTNVRGSKSFTDLLTVDGVVHATFKEAAEKLHLVDKNDYAPLCMREAAEAQMPCALRRLFASLLIFCEFVDPHALWDEFYSAMLEDFSHRFTGHIDKVRALTYSAVDKYLEGMGKSMKHFNLEAPIHLELFESRETRDISDAIHASVPEHYIDSHKRLNTEQKIAYKDIMHHVKRGKAGAFFIDGPGGTGKTFLYCALYAKLRQLGKIVLPTATSGIAASNIPTGRTAHSRFKIPIDKQGSYTCNVSKQSSLACLLRATSLLIWDEASMAKKEDIEALDSLLQDICDNKMLFGGKVVVFGGDFRQVLPVLPHKSQIEIINSSLVCSYLWPQLVKYKLTKNIRAQEDTEFAQFLLDLGNGKFQNQETSPISLPSNLIECSRVASNCTDLFFESVFPELQHTYFDPQIFSERAILTPTNEGVDAINASLIGKFPGEAVTYKGFDSIVDDNKGLYPDEFLHTICPSGMSPYELVLKPECPVILLRNLDPANGLCNGTRLICKKFRKNVILCEIATGSYKGEQVFLPRINLRPARTTYPFLFQRKQFPIKLCFAMTINKAQGQTLQKVCVYLRQPCFAHGQLYVAFSRVRRREHIEVFLPQLASTPAQENEATNVVSFATLERAGVLSSISEN